MSHLGATCYRSFWRACLYYGSSPTFNHTQRLEEKRREFDKSTFEAAQTAQARSEIILTSIKEIVGDSKTIAQDSKSIAEGSWLIGQENTQLVASIREIAEKSDQFGRRVTRWVIFLGVVQTLSSLIALYLAYRGLRASNNRELIDLLERVLAR